jgi:hypothetical protein
LRNEVALIRLQKRVYALQKMIEMSATNSMPGEQGEDISKIMLTQRGGSCLLRTLSPLEHEGEPYLL